MDTKRLVMLLVVGVVAFMKINKIRKSKVVLYNGDCLEEMKKIENESIDMVLTDPPYGITACKWDSVIPFEPMWK